jgi:hypothetical protein
MRHLDVEEHDIGRLLADSCHGLFAIGAGGNDIGVGLCLKQADQAMAPDRLIVRHYHAHCHPAISLRLDWLSGTGV